MRGPLFPKAGTHPTRIALFQGTPMESLACRLVIAKPLCDKTCHILAKSDNTIYNYEPNHCLVFVYLVAKYGLGVIRLSTGTPPTPTKVACIHGHCPNHILHLYS